MSDSDRRKLRQISRNAYARITATQAGGVNGDLIGDALEWGARRNIYNLEINNENNDKETIFLFTGEAATRQRNTVRRYTIGAYAVVCLCIDIESPVLIFTPTNDSVTMYNTSLYAAVAANPMTVAIDYYDDYVR